MSNLSKQLSTAALNRNAFASPEEIIHEARNGRMFILVDDEDRENEGDLIIPAQMATPDAINFMAKHGRGLICLALTEERVSQLSLGLMAKKNGSRHETAFAISIEAASGVTTGISAADRACTIATAIDAAKGPEHIVTPGHVFPLIARRGGVLVRAGHTEAAVDVSRLAGLNPSGVICEIMRDDGEMARGSDLFEFADRHKLKIGTIADLIAYRLHNDRLVERVHESRLASHYGGSWQMQAYRDKAGVGTAIVLSKGDICKERPIPVRVHQVSMLDDLLGRSGERHRLLHRAMLEIGEAGCGVIVLLPHDAADAIGNLGTDEPEIDPRSYGLGAQILADLGLHHMVLLSNSAPTAVALRGYGLNIVSQKAIRMVEAVS